MDERFKAIKRYVTQKLDGGEGATIEPEPTYISTKYPGKEFLVHWDGDWPSTYLVLTEDESRKEYDIWANRTLYNKGIDFFIDPYLDTSVFSEAMVDFVDEVASCIILPYRKYLQKEYNLTGPATDDDLIEIFGDLPAAINVAARKQAIDTQKFPRILEKYWGRANAFDSKEGFEDKQGDYLIYQIS